VRCRQDGDTAFRLDPTAAVMLCYIGSHLCEHSRLTPIFSIDFMPLSWVQWPRTKERPRQSRRQRA